MSLTRSTVPVLALLALCACGTSSPTAPSREAGPLTGVWTGTVNGAAVSQTVRLDLSDERFGAGSIVSGRYSATDATGTTSGTVGGAVINSGVTLTLTPSAPLVCPSGTLIVPAGSVLTTLTLTSGRLSGRAVIVQCAGDVVGTATFTK